MLWNLVLMGIVRTPAQPLKLKLKPTPPTHFAQNASRELVPTKLYDLVYGALCREYVTPLH